MSFPGPPLSASPFWVYHCMKELLDHICQPTTNTYKYIQIHTNTYKYIQIHTNTYKYIHDEKKHKTNPREFFISRRKTMKQHAFVALRGFNEHCFGLGSMDAQNVWSRMTTEYCPVEKNFRLDKHQQTLPKTIPRHGRSRLNFSIWGASTGLFCPFSPCFQKNHLI